MSTTLNDMPTKKKPEPSAEEMTEHLGHEKNRAPQGRESGNVRNGTRPKTVLTHATGQVQLEVPRVGLVKSFGSGFVTKVGPGCVVGVVT